jgi:putative ABC transport system permease protein
MKKMPLLWRWTLRDMRERWTQVVGISFIIALGVAVYCGLNSTVPWRIKSFAKSYDMLNMYDLRLELTQGSYLEAGQLQEAVRSIPHADQVEDVTVRLTFPTTVNASPTDESLVVSGRVFGLDVSGGGPAINKLHITQGRGLAAADEGTPVCVVEHNFADYHDVEPGDRTIRVSGGYELDAVGRGLSAEHFMVIEEESGLLGALAQDRYAVLFVPLATAQEIAALPGLVNEALISVPAGTSEADLDQIQREVEAAMAQAFPEVGISTEQGVDNFVRKTLYDDLVSDQQGMEFISFLLLLGAGFAAYILIGRIVEAQRREIGINMALGVTPRRIAHRYLLIGAQVAILGMVLGALLGLLINRPMATMLDELMPLPYLDSSFQPDLFAEAAFVGLLIPFLAILYPIWRAVRVAPIDAIQTGYLVSKGGGMAPLLARARLPGSSTALFPLRNLSRGMRRTVMTVLGLSVAILILLVIIGVIDTFQETLKAGREEVEQEAPERSMVLLDEFYPLSGPLVGEVAGADQVAQAVPVVILPGQLSGEQSFEVLIELMDLDNELWTPTLVRGGTDSPGPGVLINEKAARDLGVDVGDTVALRHPYRESQHAWRLVETSVQVVGIHPDIMRTTVYMDIKDTGIFNLEGLINSLHVNPTAGVTVEALRPQLSQVQGVASVRKVSGSLIAIEDFLDQYIGIFQVVQGVVLLMAFFIAFNTTRSNIEERRREIATMFAFGAQVRTVLRMTMVENLIVGILGTLVGIALGWLVLGGVVLQLFEHDAPDLDAILTIQVGTYGWAVLIGVIVVAVTPVFLTRRLIKMDIPSTLRVME